MISATLRPFLIAFSTISLLDAVKVSVSSASTVPGIQKSDLLRGLESGADDYLTKPFNLQELRARLQVGQRILDLQNGLIAARDELSFRATHDSLTGIANRGVVLDAIHREHSRQVREGGTLGIVMVDLDHFKQVNDTYGHQAGDAVLKEVARRMASCVRPYDTVGRYGGEEFLVVVASADSVGALALADRICREVASAPVTTDEGAVRITASCGVAVSDAAKPLDSEELLHAADEALYSAKQQGRNRAVLAAPAVPVQSESSPAEPTPVKSESR